MTHNQPRRERVSILGPDWRGNEYAYPTPATVHHRFADQRRVTVRLDNGAYAMFPTAHLVKERP